MNSKTHLRFVVASIFLLSVTPSYGDLITLTGADLFALDGTTVDFPTTQPTLVGTSLLFDSGNVFDKLMSFEMFEPGELSSTGTITIPYHINFTRRICDSPCVGSGDSDPHFLIGDGSRLLGVLYADNAGGQLFAVSMDDLGTMGSNRVFPLLLQGIGYPAIGEAADVWLNFILSETETTVEASVMGQMTSFTWNEVLNRPNGLGLSLMRDNDGGEQYQLNSIMVEGPIAVAIDIKPGSDPNCFNINGHGVIPVAVLGSDTFDVTSIDLTTLSFGGLEVRVRGNKGPLCSVGDSNDDGFLDLVCHFEDDTGAWSPGSTTEATLTGNLFDGTEFEGSDSICVVP